MSRASWLTVIVCSFTALGALQAGPRSTMLAPAALGQSMGVRTVSGTVLSESSERVVGATIFLKNLKTKSIRSYTSTTDGHYHFAQIDMSVDYDLWAEKDGKKSAVKTVSSWDTRKEVISDLKLK